MAQNKITATYGADISEVEAKMLAATRVTKYYENAVKQVNKAEAAQGGGSLFSKVNAQGPKAVGIVKDLASKFGAAGAAAGLVPGLGVAAIGVAGVVAGVAMIKKHYEDAAAAAAKIKELMANSSDRRIAADLDLAGDKEKLEILKRQVEAANMGWRLAVANGRDDIEILAKRQAYDDARVALIKEERAQREKNSKMASAELQEEEALKKKIAGLQEKLETGGAPREESTEYLQRRIQDARNDAASAKTNKDRLAAIAERMEMELKLQELEKKTADKKQKMEGDVKELVDMVEDARKEHAADEEKRVKELAELRYQSIWRYASLEQRLAQARKEGIEAQAKAEKDASSANMIALEKARNKYRDILAEIEAKNNAEEKGSKSEAEAGGFTTRSGKGKVSAEDRARTIRTRERNERLTQEARSRQVRSSSIPGVDTPPNGEKPMTETENILRDIRTYLTPTDK